MRVLLNLVFLIGLFNSVGVYAQESISDEANSAQTEDVLSADQVTDQAGTVTADAIPEIPAPEPVVPDELVGAELATTVTESAPEPIPVIENTTATEPVPELEPEPEVPAVPELEIPIVPEPEVLAMPEPEVPTAPVPESQAPEPASVETSDKDEWDEIKGIDTVDIDEPQGNWLLKRIWWEKAEAKYEKIKTLVEQVLESRMVFFAKHTELDRNVFDPFYMTIGLGQGELQEITTYFISQIEELREKGEALTLEERDLLQALKEEQETVEQLTKDVHAIGEYDTAINEALATLMEQMNLCRKYEREAWDAFKAIAKELSDKRARDLYYSMEAASKNINNIKDYVTNVFSPHFNQLTQQVEEYTEKVKSALELLKEKGVDVKKQAEVLERYRRPEAPGMSAGVDEDDDEDDDTPQVTRGWFSWAWDILEAMKYWWSGVA